MAATVRYGEEQLERREGMGHEACCTRRNAVL